MIKGTSCVSILILGLSFALPAEGQEISNPARLGTPKSPGRKQVDLKDFHDPSSPTAGLQAAIDHLKPEGGIVHVPPGTYPIRRAVMLASGITLLGSGEHSVIARRDPCVQRPLRSAGKEGATEIQLDDVSGFFQGGEVTVFSRRFAGFNCTAAVIVEVKGQSLVLDRPLRRDYLPEEQAGVVNFFPAFTARSAEKIQLENLAIDGGMKPGSDFMCDFVCSAIHLVHVRNIIIDRVIVRNYPGDGFSVQGGSNAYVTNSLAEHNLGNGFHPGTTVQASKWTHNTGRFNGKDGLFFCFNVRYATVADNHFHDNRKNGIGDLGKGGDDGDQMNVVSGNYCYNNGLSGIECTAGGNNTVINNICENNSRSDPGKWPGIYLSDTHSTIIQGNRCSDRDPATRSNGILLVGQCENNLITGNLLAGYPVGIAGDNLAMNTLAQNIILKEFKEGKAKR